MTTTHTRTKALTAAVGAAIATIAAPALLALGGGTAQATPDISASGLAGIIDHLKTPRGCSGCDGLNPQPGPGIYPPEIIDPGNAGGPILPGAAAPKVGDAQNTVGVVVIGG